MRYILITFLLLFLFQSAFQSAHAQSWSQVYGPISGSVRALASGGGQVYAGTDVGVFVSSDRGSTWTLQTSGLTSLKVYALAVTQSGAVLVGTKSGGVFRSVDKGQHWSASNTGLTGTKILSLAIDHSGNVFAGDSVHGVFVSSDDGQSWTTRTIGMNDSTAWSLMVTPSGVLYAGTTGYILFSTDLGGTWTSHATPMDKIYGLLADAGNGVYAGGAQGIFYISNTGSTTWRTEQPPGLGFHIQGMAVMGQELYAASTGFGQGLGIFGSPDGGTHWYPSTEGLDADPSIYSLAVTAAGDFFAGSQNGYIFRIAGPPSSVARGGTSAFRAEAYPNPFVSAINVYLNMTVGGHITLSLYNALGEKVEQLYDGWLAAGVQTVSLSTNIPSRTYFLRLVGESSSLTIPLQRGF